MALMAAINIMIDGLSFIKMNDIIDSGASFCQVDRIRAGIHEIDVITDGYQKWHGAIPILMTRETIRTAVIGVRS